MNTKATGYILGAVAAATYGMNPLFALPLYKAGMDPDSVLFLRYLLAIPILGIMLKARGRSFKLKRKEILPLIVMGLLVSISSLTLFQSYNYMEAGIASTLLFVYPILVALIMTCIFKEKLSLQTILCIILALGGIALLYQSGDGTTLSLTGVLLSDILRPRVRLGALSGQGRFRQGTACGERVVHLAQPSGFGSLPHCHVIPLHHPCHPIHRLHPHRHLRGIGSVAAY